MKLARAAISSSLLLLGGILAHHLAGGEISPTQTLISFFLLSTLLSLLLTQEDLTEGRIFLTVFIAQNGAHFFLGGAIHEPVLMYIAHAVAGIATFYVISKSSLILTGFSNLIQQLAQAIVLPTAFQKISITSKPAWICTPYFRSFKELAHSASYSLRAPPSK